MQEFRKSLFYLPSTAINYIALFISIHSELCLYSIRRELINLVTR